MYNSFINILFIASSVFIFDIHSFALPLVDRPDANNLCPRAPATTTTAGNPSELISAIEIITQESSTTPVVAAPAETNPAPSGLQAICNQNVSRDADT